MSRAPRWRSAAFLPGALRGASGLADGALHLELDQPVELDRVLQRQLLGDRLDEAPDDQAHGLGLVDAPAPQVEELLVADARHRGLVADRGGPLLDLAVGIGVRAGRLVQGQGLATDVGPRLARALL